MLKSDSIQKRLLFCILSISALFLILISGLNYFWAQKTVVQEDEKLLATKAEATAAKIENYLIQKSQYALILAENEQFHSFAEQPFTRGQDLSDNSDYQELKMTFKKIVSKDQDLNTVYLAISKHERLYPNFEEIYPPNYQLEKRPWYSETVKAEKLSFSSPYYCPFTDKLVFTIAVPFYNVEGDLLGVAAADILVDKIQAMIENTKIFKSGYAFILDHEGMIISHPDSKFFMQPIAKRYDAAIWQQLSDEMTSGKSGMVKVNIEGMEKYIFYRPIWQAGWSVGIVVPLEEVTEPINALGKVSAITAIIAIILIFYIIKILTSRLIKPINTFTQLMKQVENGDYTVQAEIQSSDEIGRLGESLNNTVKKQQQLIKKVVDSAYHIRVAGHELAMTIGEAQASIALIPRDLVSVISISAADSDGVLQSEQITQELINLKDRIDLIELYNKLILETLDEKDLSHAYKYGEMSSKLCKELVDNLQEITSRSKQLVKETDYTANSVDSVMKQLDRIQTVQLSYLETAKVTSAKLLSLSQNLFEASSKFKLVEIEED